MNTMSEDAGRMTGVFDFDPFAFVTSDTHFSHARISELAGRPFATVEEMDEALVARWNALVGPGDAVLHLGDLALGPITESLPITGRLNGRKFLVPGNHDRVSTATQTKTAIERFRPLYEEQGWTILPEILDGTRNGRRLRASHYPYRGDSQELERHQSKRPVDDGTPLIHGHTHARDRGGLGNQFHVGVDAFGYAPIPFTLIDDWLAGLAKGGA
ncbi:metallophosphoesterase [Gryllotalpicola koreensis]|uniref:Metallophosphoesterase family protein n=1 Tax=Gryllotalpicola koreensis TaxID=993086 RepID=A0ABP7ZQI0_9MICO